MGMRFHLRPLAGDDVARLRTDASWRNWVLGLSFASEVARDEMIALVSGSTHAYAKKAAESYRAWPVGAAPPELLPDLALDKAWHAIHFVLAGDPWKTTADPATRAILGGAPMHDIETAYGPLRIHAPADVAAIAAELPASLEPRIDPAALRAADIYPQNDAWTDDDRAWIASAFDQLRRTYLAASARGHAAALWIA
jgi:uncharacterized protein DUF1877